MMSKRALTNISNVKTDKIELKANRAFKRSNLSPNKGLNKKNKLLVNEKNEDSIDGQNNENQTFSMKKKKFESLSDPTLSIERKVKAIDIGSKALKIEVLVVNRDPEVSESSDESFEAKEIDFFDPTTYYCSPKDIPNTVEDFDKSQLKSIESEPHYAHDVFQYYKQRETKSSIKKYMQIQPELTKGMRSVLVDWMVEVQESFELNHETLYLSVKLIDQFLMREKISKNQFQLVGATALLIAAKFDERIPPAIEDFLYICDDAYNRRDVILMEMKILKALDFDLCFPLSYRFLRRFARCAKLSMETLTLARFVLEMSLMEYEIIEEADSRVAAAALLLALRMKGETEWSETLEYYSGYKVEDISILMYRLNDIISTQTKTKTIKTKYSHKIFFEVGKTPPLPRNIVERV